MSPQPMRAKASGLSHTGRKRSANEDQFLIASLAKSLQVYQTSVGLDHKMQLTGETQATIVLVADGLGGHNSGERASELAVESLSDYLLNSMNCFYRCRAISPDRSPTGTVDEELEALDDYMVGELKKAFEFSQASLQNESREFPQSFGMATTLTMAVIIWPVLYVAHVGDSRCYLFRDAKLKQMTQDHNMAQLSAAARRVTSPGETAAKDDDTQPMTQGSSALWNVIGGGDDFIQPEIERTRLQPDDKVLLCTDGLTRHVDDGELEEYVAADETPQKICKLLVDLANERGGSDNITVALTVFAADDDSER